MEVDRHFVLAQFHVYMKAACVLIVVIWVYFKAEVKSTYILLSPVPSFSSSSKC